jgi:hypothetical protein
MSQEKRLTLQLFQPFFPTLASILDGNIVVYKTGKLLKRKKSSARFYSKLTVGVPLIWQRCYLSKLRFKPTG